MLEETGYTVRRKIDTIPREYEESTNGDKWGFLEIKNVKIDFKNNH
jgi:hypothetical protein